MIYSLVDDIFTAAVAAITFLLPFQVYVIYKGVEFWVSDFYEYEKLC